MKTKFSLLFSIVILLFSIEEFNAQVFLKKLDKNKINFQESELYQNKNLPTKFELFSLKTNNFLKILNPKDKQKQKTLKLPNAQGGFSNFVIKETPNFQRKLSEKFSMINSFSAQGIEDPTATAKISIGTDGFHAVVFSEDEIIYMDPYSKDSNTLLLYKRSDLASNKDDFTCQVQEFSRKSTPLNSIGNTNDGKLRTFRLALACSGEYAQFHLTNQNIPASATDQEKKAAVLSAMNTTMTRVNGVFERDLAVKMVLVAENDRIIFLDADTDDITDGNPNKMIDQVQAICDAQIGNANYDIGHVFSIGGDGLAGGGVVCITGQKAKGVTGRSQPIGDAYDIDYVSHEIGHQFGAMHTQNNDCGRNNATAVEPGSASTIMGYAGICSPNVQRKSDAYFHAVSIAEMLGTIQSSATCAMVTNTGNSAPTANAGANFNIPKSTPFVLTGIASDEDGMEGLTYNWEQIDHQVAIMPPLATNELGPMFRSLPSKSSPIRYMPELATVVAGATSSTWEVLPAVARELNFSFLVRDHHVGGGSTARDDMRVTVENSEAFTVSHPNSAVTWNSGTTQTITWNKGTTDVAPINCQNVNIKLSIDGGATFPITLKANTPNDGSEAVVIPETPSTTSRIMVEAVDNIFYNVNATNFTINLPSYCASTFTNEEGSAEYITNVTFNTINNDSENDLNDGYQDFTSIMTNIRRGNTYLCSVTFDADGYQDICAVFIDWNNDYVFDEDTEMYQLGIGFGNLNTLFIPIIVPVDATLGNTRMRVKIEYTNDNDTSEIGACDADDEFERGETEDYILTIEDSTVSDVDETFDYLKLFPNPTKGEFTLALNLINTDKVTVQLFDLRGRLIDEKKYYNTIANFSERIFFENASAGLFFLKVTNGDKQVIRKLIIN